MDYLFRKYSGSPTWHAIPRHVYCGYAALELHSSLARCSNLIGSCCFQSPTRRRQWAPVIGEVNKVGHRNVGISSLQHDTAHRMANIIGTRLTLRLQRRRKKNGQSVLHVVLMTKRAKRGGFRSKSPHLRDLYVPVRRFG